MTTEQKFDLVLLVVALGSFVMAIALGSQFLGGVAIGISCTRALQDTVSDTCKSLFRP